MPGESWFSLIDATSVETLFLHLFILFLDIVSDVISPVTSIACPACTSQYPDNGSHSFDLLQNESRPIDHFTTAKFSVGSQWRLADKTLRYLSGLLHLYPALFFLHASSTYRENERGKSPLYRSTYNGLGKTRFIEFLPPRVWNRSPGFFISLRHYLSSTIPPLALNRHSVSSIFPHNLRTALMLLPSSLMPSHEACR